MLRAGVVPERTLRRLSSLMVLLVCTGNTCRSPMAEMLCRQLLAQRLGCKLDELEDHGVLVMSAGHRGHVRWPGEPRGGGTVGRDEPGPGGHETQPLTEALVRHADVIYTMTRSHREAIVAQWPAAAERTSLLSGGRIGHLRSDRRTARISIVAAQGKSKPQLKSR